MPELTVIETLFTPWQSLAGGVLIGLASVLLMLTLGRVMGATGVLAAGPTHLAVVGHLVRVAAGGGVDGVVERPGGDVGAGLEFGGVGFGHSEVPTR